MLPLQLYDEGILVVPCNHEKPIRPLIDKYEHWRDGQPPTREQYEAIWSRHQGAGLLMMCEGIEVIDLDTKNQEFGQNIIDDFENELRNLDPFLLGRLVIEQSPSGGMHYIYRTNSPGASCTLARRPASQYELTQNPKLKFYTLVDYLAHKKMCRIHPSRGYTLTQGSFLDIPVITDDERRVLLSAALSLNSYYDQPEHINTNGHRPGDEYNERTSPDDLMNLLQRHGWRFLRRRGQYIDLNRPGAKNPTGVDATIHTEQKWFYPWSSSCGFPQTKAYDFFGAYAVLEHSGDIGRAARALGAQGLGSREQTPVTKPQAAPAPPPAEEKPAIDGPWDERLKEHIFSFEKNYDAEWMLYHRSPYTPSAESIPLLGLGQIGVIIGPAKSFKSQIVGAIVSSALGRPHESGFEIKMPFLKPRIVLIDTEQDTYYFGQSVKRIHWQANIGCDLPNFTAVCMTSMTAGQRMDEIMSMVIEDPTIGLVIIDGLLDIVNDYNDPKEAARLSEWLLTLKSHKVMVLTVIHTGEAKGNQLKPIGSVGSMILRKGEFFIVLEIMNPNEEDEKLRRVKVRPRHGRGQSFRSVEIMSYEKMVYLAGREVPGHYRTHAHPPAPTAEEKGTDTPVPAPVNGIVIQPPMPSPRVEPEADGTLITTPIQPTFEQAVEMMGAIGFQLEGSSTLAEKTDDELFEQFLNEY